MNLKLSKPVQELEIVLSNRGGVVVLGYGETRGSGPSFERHLTGREMIADYLREEIVSDEDVEDSIQFLKDAFLAAADYLAAIKRMRDVEI